MARGVLCPSCGDIASATDATCPRCGTALDVEDATSTQMRRSWSDATVRAPIPQPPSSTVDSDEGDTVGARTTRFAPYEGPPGQAPPAAPGVDPKAGATTDVSRTALPKRERDTGSKRRSTTGERKSAAPATEPVGRPNVTRGGAATQPLAEAAVEVSGSLALIGKRLGEYVVEERIGMGGMGAVYRARQPLIGTYVAIKVLRGDVMVDKRDLQRFLDEARVVNGIKHRGIINIFNAGELDDGRQYLVMEHLVGETLEKRLERQHKLTFTEVAPILHDVASALAAAHGAGVVHRDLKPANVFLVPESGGRTWVKLLDFGLARRTNQELSRIAGTPDYISPEHARGKPAGPPSDMYALGVMTFHVLTGRLPFLGNSPMAVMEQHVHHAPPVPSEVEPSIPVEVSRFILSLLAKSPGDRPTAKETLELLDKLQLPGAQTSPQPGASTTDPGSDTDETGDATVRRQTIAATPESELTQRAPPGPERTRKVERSSPSQNLPILLAALAVVALLGTLWWTFFSEPSAGPQPPTRVLRQPDILFPDAGEGLDAGA